MRTRSSLGRGGDAGHASASESHLETLKNRVRREDRERNTKNKFIRWLEDVHFKYNITSGLYMLDPWERFAFNLVALLVFLLVVFSAYRQMVFIWNFFTP